MTTLTAAYSPQSVAAQRARIRLQKQKKASNFEDYRFTPERYIPKFLDWTPWRGKSGKPGQQEVLDAYTLALRQQIEKAAFEQGEIPLDDLEYYKPDEPIKNWIRVEAGHTIGKTKLSSGIVSHFFDCFQPSIGYCFAPSYDQINDLLFKELRTDRQGRDLPGTVLKTPEITYKGNHFVKGRATNNAHNRGTERVQGQHEKHLIFVLDEAEGISDFVWDAVQSMTSGGIVVIVLMLANPKTRSSQFYKIRTRPNVANFRISCLNHPNVIEGREVVPNAVRRDYVVEMLEHCEQVEEHNPDDHTFELPWQPGVIYKPDAEFMFRVLGIAPANLSDNTFCPVGRYEAAINRKPFDGDDPKKARIGIDVARYGADVGTLYTRFKGACERRHQISKQDGYEYYIKARQEGFRLAKLGVTDIQFRVDGGGGYGSTCIDNLNRDMDLQEKFEQFKVIEVHNNGIPYDDKEFADLVTEMYYHSGEALRDIALINPPDFLEEDLTERAYRYVTKGGKEVKKLTPKENFKKDYLRSPDDGDGYVLAASPDFVFAPKQFYSAEFLHV